MAKIKLKIGFLISYDYNLVFNSIPLIYDLVDEIYLSYDVNFNTWSGMKANIPSNFFDKISEIDFSKKIVFHTGDFYLDKINPMNNETNQRNLLKKAMGNRNWNIQIDVDEYFINFDQVKKFLLRNNFLLHKKSESVNIRGKWVTLFKKIDEGYLYIDNEESFSFVNNALKYDYARNVNDIKQFQSNFYVIHQSWARSEDEIYQKISNWGHKNDFDVESFFKFWKSVDLNNYQSFEDFHPVYPSEWKKINFIECSTISEFIEIYKNNNILKMSEKTELPSNIKQEYLNKRLKFWK